MSRFRSEALGGQSRAGFTSGNERIDHYFRTVVSQDIKRRYAACYILIEQATDHIAGFYTLSASNILLTDIPENVARKLPRYPTVPAVLIGWLARENAYRGQDIDSLLLYDAIARIVAAPIGAHAIFVDATDEAAAAFYIRHEFMPLQGNARRLYLPVATAERLMRE